jgi:NAD(P)H-dependent FMN reductase
MITIIAGTNRRGSVSSLFADQISSIYNQLDVDSKVLDLSDLPPETFSPDAYSEKPPKFWNLLNRFSILPVSLS